jgi:hypothetical protein
MAAPGLSAASGAGTGSGGTANSNSPGTRSACRLVASTRSSGAARNTASTSMAESVRRCSQLSRTSSICWWRRCSMRIVIGARAEASGMRRALTTVCGSSAGSRRAASSTSHVPSANALRSSRAMRSASRVLPTPPSPVSVTIRVVDSSCLTSAISCRRPTRLVISAGRSSGRRCCDETPTSPPQITTTFVREPGGAPPPRSTFYEQIARRLILETPVPGSWATTKHRV